MDSIKEELEKLSSTYQSLITETGYFAKKRRKIQEAEERSKAPLIAPKKLFETFISKSAEEGTPPMLNDLVELISGQNKQLQESISELSTK